MAESKKETKVKTVEKQAEKSTKSSSSKKKGANPYWQDSKVIFDISKE